MKMRILEIKIPYFTETDNARIEIGHFWYRSRSRDHFFDKNAHFQEKKAFELANFGLKIDELPN